MLPKLIKAQAGQRKSDWLSRKLEFSSAQTACGEQFMIGSLSHVLDELRDLALLSLGPERSREAHGIGIHHLPIHRSGN